MSENDVFLIVVGSVATVALICYCISSVVESMYGNGGDDDE